MTDTNPPAQPQPDICGDVMPHLTDPWKPDICRRPAGHTGAHVARPLDLDSPWWILDSHPETLASIPHPPATQTPEAILSEYNRT